MSNNEYTESKPYEYFITKARNCASGDEYGANNGYMVNLIRLEQSASVKDLDREKILTFLKKNLIQANRFAIKRPMAKADRAILKTLTQKFQFATTSAELLAACKEGVAVLENLMPR